MKALAVIPSIGMSPLLLDLVSTLRRENVDVLVIDNHPEGPTMARVPVHGRSGCRFMWRPEWRGIYRQWNFGLRLGAWLDVPTLILNDDIMLPSGAATTMVDVLRRDHWAILGFDYDREDTDRYISPVRGTYRHGGVGGFAFGTAPRRCARIDRRFRWWGGDDDLMLQTERDGGRVGILRGCHVHHPEPSYTANQVGHLLPEGWIDNDRALLAAKGWGAW